MRSDTAPPAIICLMGPATLVNERVAALLDQWLPPSARTVDAHTFHAGLCAFTDVLDCVRCVPMDGPWRVVVVRGCERLTSDDLSLIEAYARAPALSGRLILIGDETVPPALVARITMLRGAVEQLSLETPRDGLRWARAKLAAHGQQLSPDAVPALEQLFLHSGTGTDPYHQLEQLSLYAADRPTIDRAAVEQWSHAATPGTVFELADAVGSGETPTALRLLAAHAPDARRLPELIGVLAWHVRRLWMGRRRLDEGTPLSDVARELKVPRSVVERWGVQVRRWHALSLRQAAALLLEADLHLKCGAAHPALLVELLVIRLATLPDGGTGVTSSGPPCSRAGSL